MKKVLILLSLLLAFCAQSALAQGKGPAPDGPTAASKAGRGKDAKKEQPAEQPPIEPTQQPAAPADQKTNLQAEKKSTDEPLTTSTAAVMTLNEGATAPGATSDAPLKTAPIVPVSASPSSAETRPAVTPAPASKEDAAKKRPPAKNSASEKEAAKKRNKEAAKEPVKEAARDAAKDNVPTASSSTASGPGGAASPAQTSAQPAPVTPASTSAATTAAAAAPLPTSIYRIGVGDVLDVRLLNTSSRESTLYTVLPGGLLEYPLAGAPVQVAGLTPEEVSARLASAVKVFDNPRFIVNVREYTSHTVLVTGLVTNPGPRILRREAMPLYVVLAESQPHAEAARATVMRTGAQNLTLDLSDSAATAMLVQSGDVIKVEAAPPKAPQYYFIGGLINMPGQKDFHQGLTLTQAILASGGTQRTDNARMVRVSRQGPDGRLVTTEYNLKLIDEGQVPDPLLQPGDRVEIGRGRW